MHQRPIARHELLQWTPADFVELSDRDAKFVRRDIYMAIRQELLQIKELAGKLPGHPNYAAADKKLEFSDIHNPDVSNREILLHFLAFARPFTTAYGDHHIARIAALRPEMGNFSQAMRASASSLMGTGTAALAAGLAMRMPVTIQGAAYGVCAYVLRQSVVAAPALEQKVPASLDPAVVAAKRSRALGYIAVLSFAGALLCTLAVVHVLDAYVHSGLGGVGSLLVGLTMFVVGSALWAGAKGSPEELAYLLTRSGRLPKDLHSYLFNAETRRALKKLKMDEQRTSIVIDGLNDFMVCVKQNRQLEALQDLHATHMFLDFHVSEQIKSENSDSSVDSAS